MRTSANVTFNVTDGYMEITPVTEEVIVTIEGNHDSKVYDGEEHKVTGYKVTAISNELYTEGDFELHRNSRGEAYGSRNDHDGAEGRGFCKQECELCQCDL